MEFRDLKQQYQVIKGNLDKKLSEVMESANFIMGEPVVALEKNLAEYVGRKYCITCANGTDALQLVMMAWGIGQGDAVLVPDFTFFSTAEIVASVGATPIFVDVDENTFNISANDLEHKIQKLLREGKLKVKAVISVDLFGLPADYIAVKAITDKYQLMLLEDGAQGFGGKIGEKKACSFGDASTTSFFPAKPLGCYGDGGAIFVDDKEVAQLLQSYRIHGKGKEKYDNIRIGMNSRLDTIQAVVLAEKLKIFADYELENVNKAARWYNECIGDLVKTPKVPSGFYSSWAQYTIQLHTKRERDELQRYLKSYDIPSMIYYSKPMHQQKAFMQLKQSDEQCPVSTRLCETVLSLPMHPYLKKEELTEVADKVNEFMFGCNL